MRPWLEEGTGDVGVLVEHELEQPMARKKPTKIFVCSTFELFYHRHGFYRDPIFKTIEACPQHTFQILTKMPENIYRPMPENVWLGVSVTNHNDVFSRYEGLLAAKARVKFISFEPLLECTWYLPTRIDWAIIGKLSGYGKKYDPSKALLKRMVREFKFSKVPVFLKNNLKDIWGENLIQEWPK